MKIASVKNLVDHTLNQYATEETKYDKIDQFEEDNTKNSDRSVFIPEAENNNVESIKPKEIGERCVTFSPVVAQRNFESHSNSETPESCFSNDAVFTNDKNINDYMKTFDFNTTNTKMLNRNGSNYK